MRNQRNDNGFVLFELLAIVIILLLLATFAVPRFASLEKEAHLSSAQAFAGRVRSAAAVAHAVWLAQGQPQSIELHEAFISFVNGYPDLATIDDALTDRGAFVYDQSSGTFAEAGMTPNCSVRYEEAGRIGAVPIVTTDVTGC